MTQEELLHELPKGLIKWYQFRKGARALFVTAGTKCDRSLCDVLTEAELETDCRGLSELDALETGCYDYAVVADAVAREKNVNRIFERVCRGLKSSGTLFVCAENRLGLRFFCGDKDPYTGGSFDGIEDYKGVSAEDYETLEGRLYAKAELVRMLEGAGFAHHRFYSVFPDMADPQVMFAEDYTPVEELNIRLIPQYHDPSVVFLEEGNLYAALIENGLFHAMANGFLIECPMDGNFSNAYQITISMDRGRVNALSTVIRRDGKVEKRPIYAEGNDKAGVLMENQAYLEAHGVRMIEAEVVQNSFVMPYVEGEPLMRYFCGLAETDRDEFLRQFDRLWELILASSEHVPYEEIDWERYDPWWDEEKDEKRRAGIDRGKWKRMAFGSEEEREELGVILKRGFIDLVLLNGFAVEDDFVFYDQELYMENMPAKAIMLRNINFLYQEENLNRILPKKELLARYHIGGAQEIFDAYIGYYLVKLRNIDVMQEYNERHLRDDEAVRANRKRMNCSALQYQRTFVDVFRGLEEKKLYLFGSGEFAERFIEAYRGAFVIEGAFDNRESKWGGNVAGIEILPPSRIRELKAGKYKVMICVRDYKPIVEQLKEMGVQDYSVYNPQHHGQSQSRASIRVSEEKTGTSRKKYAVGYVAGAFDMFHIGHLNLMRRAKEQCDYLIVGVMSDERMYELKHKYPVIPCNERMQVAAACRYADQVEELPLGRAGIRDAYHMFHFDCMFSGDDHSTDPGWLNEQAYLRQQGSDIVFLPYTKETSSTEIKNKAAQQPSPT